MRSRVDSQSRRTTERFAPLVEKAASERIHPSWRCYRGSVVVKIGQKRAPDNAIGRLVDCHGRIRTFLAVVQRLGAVAALEGDDVKSAARDVRRYFSEALPRHVEDEEMSLLPRLIGKDAELDAALQRMHEEHEAHERLVSELLSICEALMSGSEVTQPRLRDLGIELGRELEAHLVLEETIIFPAIDRWVAKSEQEKIVSEMKERRSERGPGT